MQDAQLGEHICIIALAPFTIYVKQEGIEGTCLGLTAYSLSRSIITRT